MKFKRKLDVIVSKLENEYVVMNSYSVFHTNEIGARVIDLCTGEYDITEISSKLSKKYGTDLEIVKTDVLSFIKELKKLDLIDQIDG